MSSDFLTCCLPAKRAVELFRGQDEALWNFCHATETQNRYSLFQVPEEYRKGLVFEIDGKHLTKTKAIEFCETKIPTGTHSRLGFVLQVGILLK